MTTDGGEIFFGKGNVKMAPLSADCTVKTDDFAVIRDIPDVDTTGIPDSSLRDTAHSGQYHTCGDVFFPAKRLDRQHQIISPAKPDTVALQITGDS